MTHRSLMDEMRPRRASVSILRRSRRWSATARIVALACAAAASATLGAGCQKRAVAEGEQHRPPPASSASSAHMPVRLSDPEKVRFTPDVLATGNLKPQQSAQLAMPVPGTLQRVLVKRGQQVRAGETLAVLDAAAARASLAQSGAGIAAAEAQLRLADDALTRTTSMRAEEVVPESQFIQVKGQRDLAAAQLQAAQAQNEQARVLLRNHSLTAPFSGVVIRVPDGVGMPVGPQAPLFAIEDVHSLVLETSLTQEEAAELPPKATATVLVPATGARVENATVRLVVPSVDTATNRVPIEIAVPNPNGALLPHAFARAHLPSAGARDAYRVRQGALTQREGEFSVWIAGADGKAHTVRVRVLGPSQDDFAIVDFGPAGFPAGARIVDTPPLALAEGTRLVGEQRP